jgi:hypothetical protein
VHSTLFGSYPRKRANVRRDRHVPQHSRRNSLGLEDARRRIAIEAIEDVDHAGVGKRHCVPDRVELTVESHHLLAVRAGREVCLLKPVGRPAILCLRPTFPAAHLNPTAARPSGVAGLSARGISGRRSVPFMRSSFVWRTFGMTGPRRLDTLC